ncbi:MAG: glycoside hydrolase family 27 protein [Clostridia bacterium]|nr:glycoside hydrolase family 27 protein [Clostridia bacterium]
MLAKTPPMGWNSWNTFTNNINEEMIMQMADAMVEKGLLSAGYEYLTIDDCWCEMQRDANGMLMADREKFPHGMKYVADYVHSKGLKFGMYSCCGPKTCAGYPGSFGYEFKDAEYFANVGIDLLKYDNCFHPSTPAPLRYNRMALALKATGREILFSACNWGGENVWTWARSVGAHMYRSTGDITDTFESIRKLSESQLTKLEASAPGCFNDIDMLVCGLYGKGNVGFGDGCTDAQYRYHFALWCMLMSPLMIGCDIRNMSDETYKLITNKDLIAINQDEEARPPMFVEDNHGMKDNIICFRHLAEGEFAIGFFNPYERAQTIMLPYFEIGLDPLCGYGFEIRDVISGEELGVHRDYLEAKVEATDCRIFRAKIVKL